MRPIDDWCRDALIRLAIARRILRLEKAQEGHVYPAVQSRADWWLRKAEDLQREHELQA
jgi:hypothetical protein